MSLLLFAPIITAHFTAFSVPLEVSKEGVLAAFFSEVRRRVPCLFRLTATL